MTNQASEDIRNHISRNICHEAYGSEYEELNSVAKLTHDKLVDEIIMPAINAIIRTEKLKLLAEVRERVVGEDKYPAKESSDLMKQLSPNVRRCEWQNELRGEQRTLLDKLEAEL